MHDFHYRKDSLHCEKTDLAALADRFGTPLYVYSRHTLIDHYTKLKRAFAELRPLICYSVKANSNLSILKTLVSCGSGLDIVSGGELYRAMKIGADPSKIVYASVGKTPQEIACALRAGIGFFNVESLAELVALGEVAARLKRRARVCIRVNPNVDPHTHKYITTGTVESKFGVDFETARIIFLNRLNFPSLEIIGIHVHIGSQIVQADPFLAALKRVLAFIRHLRSLGLPVTHLNIGGGLGIIYRNEEPQTAEQFASAVVPLLRSSGLKIILEPGRFIVGNAGVLLTRVIYVKQTGSKRFVVVDAGMNDLIRPSLYEAYHDILPLKRGSRNDGEQSTDIVGPICESGDFLAKDRVMPLWEEGDLLAVMSAGAYGFSMASNYNSRCRAAEVLVKGASVSLIRRRETMRDVTVCERVV